MQQLTETAGYDTDFALWAETQAAALRERRFDDLDLENLSEEIDSLSRSDRREIRNRLTQLCFHLLKWLHQPEQTSGSWSGSIIEQSTGIRVLTEDSPSLRAVVGNVLAQAYANARPLAVVETHLSLTTFPVEMTPEFDRALQDALAGDYARWLE
jgi:hypothetical protein